MPNISANLTKTGLEVDLQTAFWRSSGLPTIHPQSLDPLPTTTKSIIREHALSR
jgi:hypothetical protein